MRSLLLLSLLACGSFACGSSDTLPDGGGDGSVNDGALTDHAQNDVVFSPDGFAVDGGGPPVSCPASAPAAGSACTGVGLCEYGPSFWPECDVVMQCDGATWTALSSNECPTPVADGGCPAEDAGLTGTCSNGGWCEYPALECLCTPGCGGPPPMPTAGDSWVCTAQSSQPTGCPWPRPRFGSSCSVDNQFCAYEICCGGAAMTCTGGHWEGRIDMFGCP